MKFGVLVFPGSNCDHDAYHVIAAAAKQPVTFLWHASHDLQDCDAIVVPGGFAYGDYLRTGAIARSASFSATRQLTGESLQMPIPTAQSRTSLASAMLDGTCWA